MSSQNNMAKESYPYKIIVATRPEWIKSLCISVIPGSVMLTRTVLEDL